MVITYRLYVDITEKLIKVIPAQYWTYKKLKCDGLALRYDASWKRLEYNIKYLNRFKY